MIDSSNYLDPDSTDDQTSGFQAFLDAAAGRDAEVIPGTYLTTTNEIHTGTELWMKGAVFKAHQNLPAGQLMLVNSVRSGSTNQYYDSDITLHHLTIDGANLPGRTNCLVAFIKCRSPRLISPEVRNNSYQGVAFGGCFRASILDADMHGLGRPEVTQEGGPAVWIGSSVDGSKSLMTDISGGYYHDLEWSAFYAGGVDTRISNVDIRRVKESAVFGEPEGFQFRQSFIRYVDRKYISASGIEMGGSNIMLIDNVIEYTGNCAIDLTDTLKVTVSGLHALENGTEPSRFPQASVIGIRTSKSPYVWSTGITISGVNSRNVVNNLHAFVSIGGPGSPITNLRIDDSNNVSGNVYKSGKAVFFEAGKQGANCYVSANL